VPQEHQVVYTTLHFEQPWLWRTTSRPMATRRWRKILAEKPDPATIIDDGQELRPARAWRRRLPDRPEVEFMPRKAPGQKYILCNSDESEPGTCKDRDILRYNPHAVVEGLAIACYATGSTAWPTTTCAASSTTSRSSISSTR
jgi:NADH-quinone oxidoreductase subunit F